MSKEYPKEAWNEINEKVGQWIDTFVESRQFERIADSHKNETRGFSQI